MRTAHRLLVAATVTTMLLGGGTALADARDPGDTPARPVVSNMGLCSAFLGQLGVRDDINHMVRAVGAFLPDGPYDSPGELYRIRARQHPDAPAAQECTPRGADGRPT